VHWSRTHRLPASLEELVTTGIRQAVPRDPVTQHPYEYRARDGAAYELCATFDRASANGPSYVADPLWAHASGRQCFPLVAKDLNADRAR